jgi:hypothetical protein
MAVNFDSVAYRWLTRTLLCKFVNLFKFCVCDGIKAFLREKYECRFQYRKRGKTLPDTFRTLNLYFGHALRLIFNGIVSSIKFNVANSSICKELNK